mgnify:CR=1 FL=1
MPPVTTNRPLPGMQRDPCTCLTLRTVPRQPNKAHGGALHVVCDVCQAWEAGWVLVAGERRYRTQRWLAVHDTALRKEG